MVQDDLVARTAQSLAERLYGVALWWMGQAGACDRLADLLGMPAPKDETPDQTDGRRATAAKVSVLVIVNALIFREQLAMTDGLITPLGKLENQGDIVGAARAHIRKEDVVAKVLAARGEHPGLVHIISAMEACESYKPWHDKASGRTFLKPDSGKCLHDYFYFIDEVLGLCYLCVPTWCPFRLQFYCNGHSWLARKLCAAGIDFAAAGNAFVRIADIERAQALADALPPDELHRRLDRYAERLCPVARCSAKPTIGA